MKRRISDLTHAIFMKSTMIAILLIFASVVALILYFGFYYLSEYFSLNIKISYWIFFIAIASMILILFIWFRFFSKVRNGSQSNATRHHEDTNWISSHVDNDYWDPPNDYYDK
jgi:MFS-type transporter involved in bile tolerance (Atg22 family)